jgi:hypothetical protein
MAATSETGFLLIADLTGYTTYLAKAELEHAPAIAADLLETIVEKLEPPLQLAKFEGDAAFLSIEDGQVDCSLLLDAVEASYIAFRRRLRSIDQATSCGCKSCDLAPQLNLKLFVHHGSYVRTRIAGREELAGSDVILVHRLCKGEAAANAGGSGFALFTAAASDALGLRPAALGLTAGEESFEHLGKMATFKLDLENVWQREARQRRLDMRKGNVLVDLVATVDAHPTLVWAHLTSPSLRTTGEGSLSIEEQSPAGRRGVGTTSQCVTGRLATIEEVIDWQPYDHVGWRLTIAGIGPVAATADLVPDGDGTRLRMRWASESPTPSDAAETARLRTEREAAFERLANVIAGSLPPDRFHPAARAARGETESAPAS